LEARIAAEWRAQQLLVRMLSAGQRNEFRHQGYFSVDVPGWGKFCILPCRVFNVLHLKTGVCYCAVPQTEVPLSDLMLAQKLLLENDPDRFFKAANRRREFDLGPVDEQSRPLRVLQARSRVPRFMV
jgi:hypothetical protein